jgi:hypothetical protein
LSNVLRVGSQGGVPFFNATAGIDKNGVATPITATSTTVDSGIQMVEALNMHKFAFQCIGTGANFTATFYGTLDPAAYQLYYYGTTTIPTAATTASGTMAQGLPNMTGRGSTSLPATSWFPLPAPSEESGTGASSNPMVATGSVLAYTFTGLVAVRCVVVTQSGFTGSLQVLGFATG